MSGDVTTWVIIVAMGAGSFLLRFTFLGLVGDRPLPEWLLRHLRYTAVAILPALVAPLVVWPQATAGAFDLPRTAAALATIAAGLWTGNMIAAIAAGGLTLYGFLAVMG